MIPIAVEDKKLSCFISCSTADLPKAQQLRFFLEKNNVETIPWNDSFFPGMTIYENLQNVISKVDCVIFLVPSEHRINSKSRENIIFEMGLMMGSGKPILPLVEKSATGYIPSDLHSIMYLSYDSDHIEKSFSNIINWVNHFQAA